ncbi:trigger factor [Clostridia bacterium]|nr:trigger factor [Clostridia bacterium]
MNIGTLEKVGTNTSSLKLEFTPEEFNASVEKVFNLQKSKIILPGFRKGKVTRKMLENYYGDNLFYDEAISELLKEHVPAVIIETGLDLVDRPDAKEAKITKEKGLDCTLELTTKPEITITNYKGLKAAKIIEAVSDEAVDEVVLREQQKREAETLITDRPAEIGDVLIIDFKGFLDGVAFQGSEAKNHELKLGSNQFVPGFEDAIVGHSVGEKFYIDVTFPEEYGMETLAGKATKFRIKIHSIKSIITPDIDDEFAKDVSEFDTLEEYKADIRKRLEESADKAADINFTGDIIEQIVEENFEGEIPQCMFEQRIDSIIRDLSFRLAEQNIKIEDYLAYTNSDIETLRGQYNERAIVDVKVRLALAKIAELENIIVPDEELDAEYAKIAEREEITVEELPKYLSKDLVKADLIAKKANEYLLSVSIVDNTIVKEKELKEEDKEALAEAVEDLFTEIAENAEAE